MTPTTPEAAAEDSAAAPVPPEPGDTEPSTRDRKKQATRARIHLAAVRLGLERGVSTVTAEEIASEARVSPRTFFNYFATKEDAFIGDDPDRPRATREAVLSRPATERTAQAIRVVVTERLLALTADAELWRMRSELSARHPELAARIAGAGDRIERALVEAAYIRAGTDPMTDLEPGITARVAMAAVRSAMHQHRLAGSTGSLADRLDAAFGAVGLDARD